MKASWILGSALVVAVVGGVAACSGSTTGTSLSTGSGGMGPTAQAACADVAKARCALDDACTNDLGTKVVWGDLATCEARGTASCVTALGAPDTSQTPATIEACAAATPMESCSDFLGNNPVSACVPKPGGLVDGKGCAYNAQCSSTFCRYEKGAACGVCVALPKAGDACEVNADCGRGLVCDKTSSTCVAPAAKDAACGEGVPCGAGLTCVGATMMAMGKCQASGAMAGAACDPKHQTGSGCDASLGLFCSPTSKQCEAMTLATAGQPCGVVNKTSFAICTGGALCVLASASGTCVAPAAEGAACDSAKGPPCENPARCVTTADGGTAGTCKLPDPTCM